MDHRKKAALDGLRFLVNYLCGSFPNEIDRGIIVEGIIDSKGQNVSSTIINRTIQGHSDKWLNPLLQEVEKLIETKSLLNDVSSVHLDNIKLFLDPTYTPKFSAQYIRSRLQSAKTVCIFNTYIPNLDSYVEYLKNIDSLRIILMTPYSRLLVERAEDLEISRNLAHDKVISNVALLKAHGISLNSVRFFEGMPTTPIFIIDNDIFCGFFLHKVLAIDSPHRRFDKTTNDGDMLSRQFEFMWNNSRRVNWPIKSTEATPYLKQAIIDIFPAAKSTLTEAVLRKIALNMSGIYLFARHRMSFGERYDKPTPEEDTMVTGIIQIHEYDETDGAVYFSGTVPDRFADSTTDTNRFSGTIVPFGNFAFLIGQTDIGGSPIFVGFPMFKRSVMNSRLATPIGLVLRMHPDGELLSGKVALTDLNVESFEKAVIKYHEKSVYSHQGIIRREFDLLPSDLWTASEIGAITGLITAKPMIDGLRLEFPENF